MNLYKKYIKDIYIKLFYPFTILPLQKKKNFILSETHSMCIFYISNYWILNSHCQGTKRVDWLKFFIWYLNCFGI